MAKCAHNRAAYCSCYQLADEPSEDCRVHGCGEWPPQCDSCGRFLPWDFPLTYPPDRAAMTQEVKHE